MSLNLHPSQTARQGNIPTNAVTTGINKDTGAFPAHKEVWCRQCGFRCNLARDARGLNQFAGETIGKGLTVTDHDYDSGADQDYNGSGRSTTSLSEELSNGSFEDWTGSNPDNWTVGSGSVSQETSAGYFDNSDDGISSMKIVRNGSDISVSQSPITPSDFNSNNIIFRARVKSLTNGVVKVRVTINSVNYDSSYNVAQQNFQELIVKAKAPTSVSSLTCYVLADSQDGTAWVDQCFLSRSGNPTTASVSAGCPHCGSFNYF